ncbi:MAG: NGG1 interacting factor 3 family protein [Amphiamblys sp. WSBS2006]|nr:MAG: NGG1 interacting factor 3 family protein [Amphiamblys sp. WSBS2006]
METVVAAMEKIAPPCLAETDWDNTGLIISPADTAEDKRRAVLLTIDFTKEVAEEAVARGDVFAVVSYHPPIFRPIKTLSTENIPASMLAVKNNIAVYSPHTALDACSGGINDWIAAGLPPKEENTVRPVNPSRLFPETGGGRFAVLKQEATLEQIAASLKKHFGASYMRIAHAKHTPKIRKVAICAGAGASLFRTLGEGVDCVVTGELSHHDVLWLVGKGTNVCMCEHDVSERGYLEQVLKRKLQALLPALAVDVSTEDRCPITLA